MIDILSLLGSISVQWECQTREYGNEKCRSTAKQTKELNAAAATNPVPETQFLIPIYHQF